MPRWSTGRVVLLGDAAWCVTLFAGHGAALALAGADHLGAALRRHTPTTSRQRSPSGRPGYARRSANDRHSPAGESAEYAPPSRFHVWMSDLTIRAITLPGVSGLVRRGIERANR